MGKKRKIRKMREGIHMESDGERASHKMEWGSEDKGYSVNPTLFPKKPNASTDPEDWEQKEGMEAYQEAKKRGEVVKFKSKRRAEKVAAGAWKKGEDKKEAMSKYKIKKAKEKGRDKRVVKLRQKALRKGYGID